MARREEEIVNDTESATEIRDLFYDDDDNLIGIGHRIEWKEGTVEANQIAIADAMQDALDQLRAIVAGADALQTRMTTLDAQGAQLAAGTGTVTRAQFTSLVNGVRAVAQETKAVSVGVELEARMLANLIRFVRGDFDSTAE